MGPGVLVILRVLICVRIRGMKKHVPVDIGPLEPASCCSWYVSLINAMVEVVVRWEGGMSSCPSGSGRGQGHRDR